MYCDTAIFAITIKFAFSSIICDLFFLISRDMCNKQLTS